MEYIPTPQQDYSFAATLIDQAIKGLITMKTDDGTDDGIASREKNYLIFSERKSFEMAQQFLGEQFCNDNAINYYEGMENVRFKSFKVANGKYWLLEVPNSPEVAQFSDVLIQLAKSKDIPKQTQIMKSGDRRSFEELFGETFKEIEKRSQQIE
jgi:hypothetical protein